MTSTVSTVWLCCAAGAGAVSGGAGIVPGTAVVPGAGGIYPGAVYPGTGGTVTNLDCLVTTLQIQKKIWL